MSKKTAKNLSFTVLILLAISLATISFVMSCGGGGGGDGVGDGSKPAAAKKIIIATNSTPNSSLLAMAVDKDTNEGIAVTGVKDTNGKITSLNGIIYILPNGKTIYIALGSDGLATSLTDDNGNRAVFSNYTSSSVNITWYNKIGMLIVGPVTQTIDLSAYKKLFPSLKVLSRDSVNINNILAASVNDICLSKQLRTNIVIGLKTAGYALSVFGCAAAIAATAPTVVISTAVAYACASPLVSTAWAFMTPSDNIFDEEIELVSTTPFDLGLCFAGDRLTCAGLAANTVPLILNTFIPDCSETIPPGTPVFPFPTPSSEPSSVVGISLTLNTLNGDGTVSSAPPGWSYKVGTQVKLTAQPAPDSTFTGWGGDCSGTGVCNLTMNRNMVVFANFAKKPQTTTSITTTVRPTTSTTTTVSPTTSITTTVRPTTSTTTVNPGGTCSSGNFSCGNPAGGPTCCPVGNSCCFGYNLCCNENMPHLGTRRSDGVKMCFQSLQNEGVTWDLLTVCGVPVN